MQRPSENLKIQNPIVHHGVNMVFGWLYSRVFASIKPYLFQAMDEYFSSEEFGEYSLKYFDALYDRYKQKTLGMVGGYQKNINQLAEANQNPIPFPIQQMPQIDAKDLIINGIMQALIQGGQKQNPRQKTRQTMT